MDKITASPSNKYGIRDIEELAASIEQLGLLHNLVVKEPDASGNYELVSGERRYMALRLLEWPTAPCKVEGQGSAAEIELRLLHANATARVLTDYEKTMQAARIKEILQGMKADGYKFKGRMRDIVAEVLKVSPAQMGRMESIDKNLTPELKKAFENEEIGISKAYEASLLSEEDQAAAYDEFKATGELNTKKDPPPAPTATEPPTERDEDTGAPTEEIEVTATLEDGGGNFTHFTGSLALAAAVWEDTGELSGGIMGEASAPLAYIALAQAVCVECLMRLSGDKEAIGDIGNLEEEMSKKGRMKLIKWLFTLLLNEGAAFTKLLETGSTEGAEVLTEETVGLLLNGVNLTSMTSNIYKSLTLSSKGDADAPEEPQEDEEGNTKAGKES